MPEIDEAIAEAEAKADIPYEEIYSGPAVFSNRAYVTVVPIGIRFTFMETGEGQDYFRTAAYMSLLDAIALRDVLNQQLDKLAVSIKEMTKEEIEQHRAKLAEEAEEK